MEINIANLTHENQVCAKHDKPPLETDVVLEQKEHVKGKREHEGWFVAHNGFENFNHADLTHPECNPVDLVQVKDEIMNHWNDFMIKRKLFDV